MADTKITELPAASTLDGTELVPVVQSSATAKSTAGDIAALNNPMTAVGDLVIGGTAGAPARLAVGTDGYVLTLASGSPAWAAAAWINPMTTEGDLIVGGTSGAADRLAIGTDGQVLTLASGTPAWSDPAFANPMTTAGDLIIGGTDGAADRLAAGTDGFILKLVSGVPAWATNTASVAWGGITGTLADQTDLGTAAAADTTAFATAAQGTLADSATQPGDLATVATTGDYDDLTNTPTIPEVGALQGINAQSGTTYTLALTDAGKNVRCTNAAAVTVTIPPASSVAFPANSIVYLSQGGAGAVSVVGDTGVTVNNPNTIATTAAGTWLAIVNVGADEWDVL